MWIIFSFLLFYLETKKASSENSKSMFLWMRLSRKLFDQKDAGQLAKYNHNIYMAIISTKNFTKKKKNDVWLKQPRRVARNQQWWGAVLGVRRRSPQRLKILRFLVKLTQFQGYFDKKLMLLTRSIKIGSANMIKLVAKMGNVEVVNVKI